MNNLNAEPVPLGQFPDREWVREFDAAYERLAAIMPSCEAANQAVREADLAMEKTR